MADDLTVTIALKLYDAAYVLLNNAVRDSFPAGTVVRTDKSHFECGIVCDWQMEPRPNCITVKIENQRHVTFPVYGLQVVKRKHWPDWVRLEKEKCQD